MKFSIKILKKLKPSDLLFAYSIAKKAYNVIKRKAPATERVKPDSIVITEIYKLYQTIKENPMENKWKSRKFLVTLVTVIIMLLGSFLSPETVAEVENLLMAIIALVGIYLGSQSVVDAKKEAKK